MQIHQTDFSTGNVYRNIMEVAVPMIIAQILNTFARTRNNAELVQTVKKQKFL